MGVVSSSLYKGHRYPVEIISRNLHHGSELANRPASAHVAAAPEPFRWLMDGCPGLRALCSPTSDSVY